MSTIEGKHGTAACYATNIEVESIDQVRTMLDMPFAEGADTAIMPDTHFGLGCTIGTTMKVTDKIVPNLVGVGTGCTSRRHRDVPMAFDRCGLSWAGHHNLHSMLASTFAICASNGDA